MKAVEISALPSQEYSIPTIFFNFFIFKQKTVIWYCNNISQYCTAIFALYFYYFWSNKCIMYICSYVTDCKHVKIKMYDLCIYGAFYKTLVANQNFRCTHKFISSTTALKSHSHTFKLCIRTGLESRKKQCVMQVVTGFSFWVELLI